MGRLETGHPTVNVDHDRGSRKPPEAGVEGGDTYLSDYASQEPVRGETQRGNLNVKNRIVEKLEGGRKEKERVT